jgi:hypothetical protein
VLAVDVVDAEGGTGVVLGAGAVVPADDLGDGDAVAVLGAQLQQAVQHAGVEGDAPVGLWSDKSTMFCLAVEPACRPPGWTVARVMPLVRRICWARTARWPGGPRPSNSSTDVADLVSYP